MMGLFIFLLVWLGNILVCSIIIGACNSLFDLQIHSLTIFFVVPISSIVVGLSSVAATLAIREKYPRSRVKLHYLWAGTLGFVAGFMTVFLIEFVTFSLERQDNSSTISGTEYVNFEQFLHTRMTRTSRIVRSRYNRRGIPVEVPDTFARYEFFSHFFASGLSGLFLMGFVFQASSKLPFCNKCKITKKSVHCRPFTLEESLKSMQSITSDFNAIETFRSKCLKYMYGHPTLEILTCPMCESSDLLVRVSGWNREESKELLLIAPIPDKMKSDLRKRLYNV